MKTNGSAPRRASIHRATKETDIAVEWSIDGSGQGKIETGIRFFDHMLELLAKHGFFDLTVTAKGDIDIGTIAKEFGGGGHKNAAGCSVTGAIDALQKLFVEKIEQAINGRPAAR